MESFVVFGNQNLRINYCLGSIKRIKKENFQLSDLYSIICGKCQVVNIDFKYYELVRIPKVVKKVE